MMESDLDNRNLIENAKIRRPPLTSPRPDAPRRKTRDLAPVTAEYEREAAN
jgi:hypothetical protein